MPYNDSLRKAENFPRRGDTIRAKRFQPCSDFNENSVPLNSHARSSVQDVHTIKYLRTCTSSRDTCRFRAPSPSRAVRKEFVFMDIEEFVALDGLAGRYQRVVAVGGRLRVFLYCIRCKGRPLHAFPLLVSENTDGATTSFNKRNSIFSELV